MKISVIIPCYNAEKHIDNCVKSLCKQTFKDFEVIFVDDCSTDKTLEVLSEAKRTSGLNISIIHNAVNRGPGYSRNQGVKSACAEYIAFCDCDDWYEDVFLEKMYNLVMSASADIAFCGYNVVDAKGNHQERPVYYAEGTIRKNIAFGLEADSLCMLIVRTKLMLSTPLPEIRNGEDIAVVPLLIAKAETHAVTNKCLYNYLRREGSASQKPSIKVVESLENSFLFFKRNFPAGLLNELEYIGVKNMLYNTIITLFSFSYDTTRARRILRNFEEEFPVWYKNPYLPNLRLYKRIVLFCIRYKLFALLKLIAVIRNIATSK